MEYHFPSRRSAESRNLKPSIRAQNVERRLLNWFQPCGKWADQKFGPFRPAGLLWENNNFALQGRGQACGSPVLLPNCL